MDHKTLETVVVVGGVIILAYVILQGITNYANSPGVLISGIAGGVGKGIAGIAATGGF